jgi:hypothetical protein
MINNGVLPKEGVMKLCQMVDIGARLDRLDLERRLQDFGINVAANSSTISEYISYAWQREMVGQALYIGR